MGGGTQLYKETGPMSTAALKQYTCIGQYNIYDFLADSNYFLRQQEKEAKQPQPELVTCKHCGQEYNKKTTLHVCRGLRK